MKELLLTLAALVLLTPASSFAATLTVDASAVAPVPPTYNTIQAAVTAATAGDTISVLPGTYAESVTVTKQLTIMGSGAKPVITGASPAAYIVKIDTVAAGTILSNLEINGGTENTFDSGILVIGSGSSATPVDLDNLTVKNVWGSGSDAIHADTNSYVHLHNSTISLFHKRGIRFINSSGVVDVNTISGEKVNGNTRVQNLVTLWGGSTVEVHHNTLSGGLTTGEFTWSSPAVFVSAYGGTGPATANIHDNTISNIDTGVTIGSVYAETDASTATVTNNTFTTVATGVSFEHGDVTATIHENVFGTGITEGVGFVENDENPSPTPGTTEAPAHPDASLNYWGAATGPTNTTNNPAGVGASVYNGVKFSCWYSDIAKTVRVCKGITAFTFPSSTSTVIDQEANTIVVTVPFGTDVTALTPTITSVGGVLAPASGVVGNFAAPQTYSVSAGDGADKVYTVTVVVAPQQSSGNGPIVNSGFGPTGSGIAAGGTGTVTNPSTTFDSTPKTATNPAVAFGGTSSGGQVAGVSTFKFNHNMAYNSRLSPDVVELQKILIAKGYLKIKAPTGWFGPLTRAAVKMYQHEQGIVQSGIVAELTRDALNAGK